MAVAILFFRSKIWLFRGEVCNSPSHKTTKLQHLETFFIYSLPQTKIRGCVSDKLCELSQGWFSIRNVRRKMFDSCSHYHKPRPSLLWLEATRYLVKYALMHPFLYCTSKTTVILKDSATPSWFRKAFPIYSVLERAWPHVSVLCQSPLLNKKAHNLKLVLAPLLNLALNGQAEYKQEWWLSKFQSFYYRKP